MGAGKSLNGRGKKSGEEKSRTKTQGQLVGAGKSLNGRGKKSGEEKSRTKYRFRS